VDAAVAWVFGLDECKYQWAIDRYKMMQAMQQQVGRKTRCTQCKKVGQHV
jgi:propanediol dehydratase large subunit